MADDDDDDNRYSPPTQPNSRGAGNTNTFNRMPNAAPPSTNGPSKGFKPGMNPSTGKPGNKPQASMWQGPNPSAPAHGLRSGGAPQVFQRSQAAGNGRAKVSKDPRGKMDPNDARSMQYVQYDVGRGAQSQFEHGIEASHGYGPAPSVGYDSAFADLSPVLPSHVSRLSIRLSIISAES